VSEQVEVTPLPSVIHQGRYRLYQNPDGGMRIQYRRDDKDTDDFIEVPGEMVRLSQAMSEGTMSPMEFIKAGMSLMSKMKGR